MAFQSSSTLYMPIVSPPTPAPSPRLPACDSPSLSYVNEPGYLSRHEFASLPTSLRFQYLSALLADCSPAELLFISTTITPLLRRDFLRDLPPEISLHILNFIDDPQTLVRASRVSRSWNRLLDDEYIWKRMCDVHGYSVPDQLLAIPKQRRDNAEEVHGGMLTSVSASSPYSPGSHGVGKLRHVSSLPYRRHFQYSYTVTANWLHGGKLLQTHRIPAVHQPSPFQRVPLDHPVAALSSAIPTSVALDESWIVIGLANSRIHVFSARTGVLSRTLVGHESGVWAVALVKGSADLPRERDRRTESESSMAEDAFSSGSSGDLNDPLIPPTLRHAVGLDSSMLDKEARRRSSSDVFHSGDSQEGPRVRSPSEKPSDPNGASDGWGQPHALAISAGCDKELRVWDIKSGYCIYILRGHTSTVRCLKVLHGRPIALSGSRDRTIRVWDIQRGRLLRVMEGHEQSVRCLDVFGSRAVSGSYDSTCRLWDIDTGSCLQVLRGHHNQIYSVAFDGVRIASGGLDTSVRVWDAATGDCLALLQGHTALVCQIQLSPTIITTGGADGRVITFAIGSSYAIVQRLIAHDSSVTGLQTDDRFLVTSGNDGRVRLYSYGRDTGRCEYLRELSEPSESVWKIAFTRETCVIMCKRAGKIVMEIWSFKPDELG
ncbi:WD40 repeat-like protein [Laetiporus sulphureus 93-53]|uniref:WD40 repeat-like protein n=1 Tax=Laetiporus sulphureus 93-53 TaxID=1314785 RepID=A0A165EFQ7_9APHY|nr:WD40 repeat-like protein [Laetiporus sulphureus 93-53]KZT06966.1 WD40 repeat-like protein [Laetiporus sulphureus 93-53]